MLSPALKNDISTFQVEENVHSADAEHLGELDYSTRSQLAGHSLSGTIATLRAN